MKNHYIDNIKFLEEMTIYKDQYDLAKQNNTPLPKISNYIGYCFMKIAENLSRKSYVNGYTFRDELILDAIENCVQACHNFDYKISDNPFAYFTRVTHFAFIRRITKEKKQLYIKYKATEQIGIIDESLLEDDTNNSKGFEMYSNLYDFIEGYEEGMEIKKNKKEQKRKYDVDDIDPPLLDDEEL